MTVKETEIVGGRGEHLSQLSPLGCVVLSQLEGGTVQHS